MKKSSPILSPKKESEKFQLEQKFFEAIGSGDVEGVCACIRSGVDIDAKDDFGNTALHILVDNSDDEHLLRILLLSGANANAINASGETPSQTADDSNKTEFAALIAKHLASPLKPARKTFMILGYGVDPDPFLEMARQNRVLVFDAQDKEGFDDMMSDLRLEIFGVLMEDVGAEINVEVLAHGNADMELCVGENEGIDRSEIFLQLNKDLPIPNLTIRFNHCGAGAGVGRTSKTEKLAIANAEQTQDYLRGDYNLDAVQKILCPGQRIVLCAGKLEIVSDISNLGINWSLASASRSVFYCQAQNMFLPQTFKIIENNEGQFSIFKYEAPKPTALKTLEPAKWVEFYRQHIITNIIDYAKKYITEHPELLPYQVKEIRDDQQELISKVDAKAVEKYINMDFMIAVYESSLRYDGKLGYVEFYLKNIKHFSEQGVPLDLNYRVEGSDYHVLTVLTVACFEQNFDVAKILIDAGADVGDELVRACKKDNPDLIRKLVELGANVDQPAISGVNALDFACKNSKLGLVKTLLEVGAKFEDRHSQMIKAKFSEEKVAEIMSVKAKAEQDRKNLEPKPEPLNPTQNKVVDDSKAL